MRGPVNSVQSNVAKRFVVCSIHPLSSAGSIYGWCCTPERALARRLRGAQRSRCIRPDNFWLPKSLISGQILLQGFRLAMLSPASIGVANGSHTTAVAAHPSSPTPTSVRAACGIRVSAIAALPLASRAFKQHHRSHQQLLYPDNLGPERFGSFAPM